MEAKLVKIYLMVFVVFLVVALSSAMSVFIPAHPSSVSGMQIAHKPKNETNQTKPVDAVSIYDQKKHLPILMYHHVGYIANSQDQGAYDLTVSPEDFEKQVQYFVERGFHAVTIKQAYEAATAGAQLPEKPVVFTFDDGYQDVFDYALPILRKNGFAGSLAISTELLGRPGYATWDEVVAVSREGNEILSHTENHLDLSNSVYSDDDLNREIAGSKKDLEEKLGMPVDFFVYPYGKYNGKIVGLLNEVGYKMALTTGFSLQINKNSLFSTGRVRVHGQNGLEKIRKILE
jgi:peptidoglycan/xylan/chitin deacetylase (PgdA/CDA1 family)